MNKLRLRIDDLEVDTFATAAAHGAARGTVEGRNDCTCACATERGTCEGDDSCDPMCTHDLSCMQMTECHGAEMLHA
jgi:hypothetical protein